jgi:cytochrome c553
MTMKLVMAVRTSFLAVPVLFLLLFTPRPAEAVDLNETIEVCTGCHGEGGLPSQPNIPVIHGQHYYYLYVQLKDYKAGRRDSEFMTDIIGDLTKEQMKALAQYFSEKTWPKNGFRANDTDTAAAQSAATSGMCVQCHLGGYEGTSGVPRLAGQQTAYLERTMLEYKNKIRMNSQAKGSLFATYDEADIAAMARYLAGY